MGHVQVLPDYAAVKGLVELVLLLGLSRFIIDVHENVCFRDIAQDVVEMAPYKVLVDLQHAHVLQQLLHFRIVLDRCQYRHGDDRLDRSITLQRLKILL